jgi:hypothetical protein
MPLLHRASCTPIHRRNAGFGRMAQRRRQTPGSAPASGGSRPSRSGFLGGSPRFTHGLAWRRKPPVSAPRWIGCSRHRTAAALRSMWWRPILSWPTLPAKAQWCWSLAAKRARISCRPMHSTPCVNTMATRRGSFWFTSARRTRRTIGNTRNEREGIALDPAKTMDEKEAHAAMCSLKLTCNFRRWWTKWTERWKLPMLRGRAVLL